MSPFRFRRSITRGLLRLTLSRRGVSPSLRLGPVSVSRRGTSLRLGGGLSWFTPWRRPRG